MLNNDQQDNFYRRLGEIIKYYRTGKKVNQDDLAKQVGLSRVSIVNIEKGIQKVQIHTLIEISNFLNFSLDDLKVLALKFDELSTKKYDKNINKEMLQLNNQDFAKSIFEDFIKLSIKKAQ